MADSVSFGARLDAALSTSGAGGSRITRAEYNELRENLPLGSSFASVRGLREWGLSEKADKAWAAVASSDSYEDFLKSYQSRGAAGGTSGSGGRMGTWENQ